MPQFCLLPAHLFWNSRWLKWQFPLSESVPGWYAPCQPHYLPPHMDSCSAASVSVFVPDHSQSNNSPAPVCVPLPSDHNHLPLWWRLPTVLPDMPASSFQQGSDSGCPHRLFQFPPAVLPVCIRSPHQEPHSGSHLRQHPLPAPVFSHFHTNTESAGLSMLFSLHRLFLQLLWYVPLCLLLLYIMSFFWTHCWFLTSN